MQTTKFSPGAGILLHISSLPSRYGIGSLGRAAYQFVDFLASAGQKYWQVLPLSPTGYGDSPYQSCSSAAVNPYFIDLDWLGQQGLLTSDELESAVVDWPRVDYGQLFLTRFEILKRAFGRFDRSQTQFRQFAKKAEFGEYALYMAIKADRDFTPWTDWEQPLRDAQPQALAAARKKYADEIDFWLFTQYIFCQQWTALKAYANQQGIQIVGDTPIYMAYDSTDVWLHPELFLVDENKNMTELAAVPPDAFSATGQLWGNPIYRWDYHAQTGFEWWRIVVNRALQTYDILRIDHFRGFEQYYSVPADSTDAINGQWHDGPSVALFDAVDPHRDRAIIAEDLGLLDQRVFALVAATGYPGMKVLGFGFDGHIDNDHLPTNYCQNIIAYTGTHDNQPIAVTIAELLRTNPVEFVRALNLQLCAHGIEPVLGRPRGVATIVWRMIRLLYASVADTVIIPMCDVLCQRAVARMNQPSTLSPLNWSYRLDGDKLTPRLARRLSRLVKQCSR